ncbi:MAG TPA: cytochrome c oxidase assembly protein, partial [Solirubrobacteraceae bacterium]|nr:cytochrome c oxidase assembly protein [Solirubrobacteraceae bacterium]
MTPDDAWTWAPAVLIALPGYWLLYVWRWRTVRARHGHRGATGARLAAFTGALLALAVALISPVDRLGEQMFSWHMAQHILLLDVAPILFYLGLSKVLLRPVTARLQGVERAIGPLAHPAFAVLLYGGMLWTWHIPAMYELALRNAEAHVAQHLLFVTTGLIFWGHVFSPIRSRFPLRGPSVGAYMGGAKFVTGVLASAIAFSPVGFYGFYGDQPRMWGLTAGEDQQLAGAMMMTWELIVMTSAFALLFVRMLADSEREEQRRERFELGVPYGAAGVADELGL